MPQVNPNVPADIVQDTRPRTAPRNSVERGFGRQLNDEVHKLGASESSQAIPAKNITVSDNQRAHSPESQSEGAASSTTTGIQDVQDESPGPTGLRPIVRPATLKGIAVPDGQSKDENVQGSGKNGADAGNLAASSVLAVLAVLLFSPIESAGQNLPTEAPIPKDSSTKPDSDGSKVAIASPDSTSSMLAILHHESVEIANQHLSYSSQMPFSEQQETPNQKSSGLTADTNRRAQAASVSSKQTLASGAARTAEITGVPLEVQLFNAQHSNPTGAKSSETAAVILESSDSSDPVYVLRSSVEAHSIDLQHSSNPSRDPLSRGASAISKSERYPTTPGEAAPTAAEAKGSSDQLVQEEVQKILANLLSRDIPQTKATTTPRILFETEGLAQTPLSSTAEQKVDTKLDKEVRDLALNGRATIRTQKADLELQADPIPTASARTAGKGLENEVRSLGKVETTNLKLETKEGNAGDQQESTASVARENLRAQSTSPRQQLADRREEAGSGEVAAQTDRTPKTEPAPRSSPKGETAVMTEQRGEFGARSLASGGHVTLSTSGPAGSGTEQTAAVPVPSNVWEQVEKAKVIAQLVEKAHLIGGKNDGELVLSLKPEFLGRISLHASMVEKMLVATLVAESSHVKDLLESQLPVLQHSLQEQGLPVAKVVVLQGNEFSFSDASKGQSNFQQNPEPHQATPRPYQHSDPLQETDEQESSSISPIPQRPYYSRSLNLIA